MKVKFYKHKSGTYAVAHTTREGRATIIVPVIMARADTIMNGARIPDDQFHPQSWNGVPVTVQHPDSKFGSANDPDTLAKWAIGTIFNASYVDGVLKAEAWIDVQKANKLAPGLIDALNNSEPMDVSTGYFASDVASEGNLNGKAYSIEHHDLKPDHLAFLPGVEGACNWQDGCGIRANNRSKSMNPKELLLALAGLLKVNMGETSKKDRKVAVATLIANQKSPYTNEDAEALEKMSDAAFEATVNAFGDEDEPDPDDKTMGNADGEEPAEKDPVDKSKKNEVKEPKKEPKRMVQNCGCGGKGANQMSAEQKEALEFGQSQLKAHRAALVDKLVANSTMKKEEIEKFSTEQLTTLVNGLKPADVSYAGRPAPDVAKGNEITKKMVPLSFSAHVTAAKKKEAA